MLRSKARDRQLRIIVTGGGGPSVQIFSQMGQKKGKVGGEIHRSPYVQYNPVCSTTSTPNFVQIDEGFSSSY